MNRTENMIVEAFSQLLEEKAFSKITVKNIVDQCGINRNTFYYHFQDIPTLCERVWEEKVNALMQAHYALGSIADCVSVIIQYFTAHKKAVLHIYRSLPREVFLKYLNRLFLHMVHEYMEAVSAGLPISDPDKTLITRYYKCMFVGIFLDWLDAGLQYDLLEVALRICELRGDSGKQMILNACAGS